MIFGIGNEKEFIAYCKERNIKCLELPEHFTHIDPKNPGYHFVYEKELLEWITSLNIQMPCTLLFGSGDYHHLHYGILRSTVDKNHDGYSIILVDNHDDMMNVGVEDPKGKYPINCATHMRESLRKSKAVEVVHIHNKEALSADIYSKEEKKQSIEEANGDDVSTKEKLMRSILDNMFADVYLTIDIDCLGHDAVDIEEYQAFDQGKMTEEELYYIVKVIKEEKNLLGVDICGMSKDRRAWKIYDKLLEIL